MEELENHKKEEKRELPLESKRRILLQTKNHILRMPNNKERVALLNGYIYLLKYYQKVIGKDDFLEEDEFEDRIEDQKPKKDDKKKVSEFDIDSDYTRKYAHYIYRDTANTLDELEDNAATLCEKFQQIIDAYKENELCQYEYIKEQGVNIDVMSKALWDFFAFLGDDVLEIYYNILNGENLFCNNGYVDQLGCTYHSTPIDHCCIEIQNMPYCIDFYTVLAHEVGHCYEFYLQRNQTNYSSFKPYSEITSMLFESMFLEYLKENHLLENPRMEYLEEHINGLNNLSISKFICQLFRDKKIKLINPLSLKYNYEGTKEDILKSVIEDCGYVQPFYYKTQLTEINYSFGRIISNYFLKRLKKDFDTEWKNYKNFVCTVNYLPMSEVIDTYFDIDLYKEDVKTITKSYRER